MAATWHGRRLAVAGALTTALLALSVTPACGATLTGTVAVARAPVASTDVVLYAAGPLGPRELASATTDATGAFTLDYEPADPAITGESVLYVSASGGSAVASTLRLVAALPAADAPTSTALTERTTVAAAYSYAGFLTATPGGMPLLAGSAADLALLTETLTSLVDPRTGTPAPALIAASAGRDPSPLRTLDTVGALVTACATSGTNVPTSPTRRCGRVLAAATPPGAAAVRDSFQVALAIAAHRQLRPRRLFALAPREAVPPQLTAAPTGWDLRPGAERI
jgi:hypothetical protein